MTNYKFRESIRAARYEPGKKFHAGVEETLRSLPTRKRKPARHRRAMTAAAAVLCVVALAVAAPPIVRAAAPFFQAIFGGILDEVETFQALPEDEKVAELTQDYERAVSYNHPYVAQSISGTEVRITWVSLVPDDMYDPTNTKGEVGITLEYSKMPSFDPSHVDFVLAMDGVDTPMIVNEVYEDYLKSGAVTLTQAEWDDGWRGSNSEMRTMEGNETHATYLDFAIDNWKPDADIAMELKATIDGQTLSLPFTFDVTEAHAEAVKMAEDDVSRNADWMNDQQAEYAAINQSAVPIGASVTINDKTFGVAELSRVDDMLYLSVQVTGLTEHNPKIAAMDMFPDDVLIDGRSVGVEFTDNEALVDGTLTYRAVIAMGAFADDLPEESLIEVQSYMGTQETLSSVAFRYNWNTHAVTPAA